MVDRIGKFLYRLFEEYKIVRRLIVVWAVVTISWTTFMMFADITFITAAATSAYVANVGLLATVIAFYQWSRVRDKEQ
jgi:Na+/H+-translocating membrane pyrophosphatase